MNYQQHLANSAAIRNEIQRFESVHPNIYSIYELLERVEEPLLQNQIREHVIAIEGRTGPGGWRRRMDAGSMWVGWWKMGDSRLYFQPGDGLLDVAQSAWIVGGKVYLMFPQSFSLLGKSCSGCESCHVWVPHISREKQSSYHTVRHSLKSPHEHRVALFKEDPVWF